VDILEILILLVIAGICGAIAQWIVAFSPGNMLVSIIVGVVGAYLGYLFTSVLRLPPLIPVGFGAIQFDLVWAVIGSILLLLLLSVLRNNATPRIFWRG